MLTIELKRGNVWRQLDFEDVNMSLNFNVVNLMNPAKYRTEFSKTVDLPLTKANRIAFGFTERLDSMQTTSLSLARGIPARVFNDGDLIFDGKYAVTKVDVAEEKISGNLYGVINDWYNKMMALNFSNGFPEVLDSEFAISKETVYDSWTKNPNTRNVNLVLPGQTGYSPHDFIGFAPTINGEVNNFDSKSLTWGSGSSRKIGKVWEAWSMTDAQVSDATSLCENPSERQMMQYRSYNQKPYFYFDKLCQLVRKVANERDDLPTIDLDYNWFNNNNPYYKNVVYLLPNLVSDTEDSHSQKYTIDLSVANMYSSMNETTLSFNNGNVKTYMYEQPFEKTANANDPHNVVHDGRIHGTGSEVHLSVKFNVANMPFTAINNWTNWGSIPQWPNAKVKMYGSIKLRVELRYGNGTSVVPDSTKDIATWNSSNSECSVSLSQGPNGTNSHKYSWTLTGGTYTYNFNDVLASGSEWRLYVGLVFTPASYIDYLSSGSFTYWTLWHQATSYKYAGGDYVNYSDNIFANATRSNTKITGTNWSGRTPANMFYVESARSGRHLQIGDIWKSDNENSPFKVFVKYCKMMNLVFDYDQYQNKLNILPREKFFLNSITRDGNLIADWTDRVDWGKDVSFKPIQWEKKYIMFNYEKVDADRLKDFSEKYGYGYGTKKITTMYDYNSEEEELFTDNDKINASAEMSEYMFTLWDVYKTATDVGYSPEAKLPAEAFIINKKAKDSADTENCFFFRGNNSSWSSAVNYTPGNTQYSGIWITDDSHEEIRQDTFCYQVVWSSNEDTWNAKRCYTRPVFTKFNNGVCLHFSNPVEDYFNPTVVSRNDNDIYNVRWKDFIEETYNEQNKLMTCKMYLSPTDYQSIKNGKFVRIDNVIYLVNAIKDYNPAKYGLTQVELLQVSDLSAYIGEIYEEPERERIVPPTPQVDYSALPLYIENTASIPQSIKLTRGSNAAPVITIEYSFDNNSWQSLEPSSTDNQTIEIPGESKVYLRCNTSCWSDGGSQFNCIRQNDSDTGFNVGGNILSLTYGSAFNGQTVFKNSTGDTYAQLFNHFTGLVSAEHLVIPCANNDSCYSSMFSYCTSLTTAPELPATELNEECYASMFYGCTSLTIAPSILPATTLYSSCYRHMFEGCSALTTAPQLPATTLETHCYQMMFKDCTSLTVAPELNASTLVGYCYDRMFNSCTSLNRITCLATSGINTNSSTYYWVANVAQSGTFQKAAGVTWPTSSNGIPSGWTVLDGD